MRDSRYVVRWAWVLGVVAPAALAATAYVLQAAWWESVPTVVPHHWNAAGEPDAFGSRSSFPIATTVIAVALPALMMAFALPGLTRGRRGPTYRLLTAFSFGTAVLGSTLTTGAMWLHRGVAEGGPWPSTTPTSLAAVGAGVVLGTVAYFAQPHQDVVRPETHSPAPLALGDHERAVWMRSTTIPTPLLTLLTLAAVGIAVAATSLAAAGRTSVAITLFAAVLFVVIAGAMATSFRVRVDQRGVTATSVVGWPRFVVPAGEVERVAVVKVDGLGEFGGFGLRSTIGARGIIMRNGEALEVTRTGGRRLVITVDDADTAAALLTTVAARAHERNGAA